MSKPVSLLVLGAGGRGAGYSTYATQFPEEARIVGVAEPRDFYRNRLADTHKIPKENIFSDWRDAAARERFADAVMNTVTGNTGSTVMQMVFEVAGFPDAQPMFDVSLHLMQSPFAGNSVIGFVWGPTFVSFTDHW